MTVDAAGAAAVLAWTGGAWLAVSLAAAGALALAGWLRNRRRGGGRG